jgi:NAD dependent epimerase/dehydratase family enzyme
MEEGLSGPVNAVAPQPVVNAEFSRKLGQSIHRPALVPVPAPALRLLYGEMADETLLSSTRAQPVRLMESGYEFRHPSLPEALGFVLGAT